MRKFKDSIFKVLLFINLLIFASILIALFSKLIKEGAHVLSWNFLFESPSGLPPGKEGGIWPAIIGSLITFFLSSFISSILALMTAIYIVFYLNEGRTKNILRIIIQCISGIPSIVLGLFGYTLLVYKLRLGRSVLSASATLAVMIFPFIEIRLEKLFINYDYDKLETALSLGIDKGFVIRHIVLKGLRNKIIQTVTLGGSLAIGATAPIMLTGAVIHTGIPSGLLKPFMALPYHLYILINEGISTTMGYGTALVLMIILLIINTFSLLIGGKDDNY